MRLEQASVALRAREPWEAVDLGVVMLRAWWRSIYGALFMLVVPTALLLHLLFTSWPWLALLLTWWLKPLYDRAILHILAHAVFAAPPSARDTLARLPSLIRNTGLLRALSLRRADQARAFNLPIAQLEGQLGAGARLRAQVLGRRATGQATGLLYTCILFELLAMLTLSAFVDLVTPATLETEYGLKAFFRYLWDPAAPSWGVYLNHAFYVIALCAVEPLYVAGSFALYLNRRTSLEAWDLELSFRRMAQTERDTAAAASLVIGAVAIALSAILPAQETHAADKPAREVVREILAAPEFQEHRTTQAWQKRAADDAATRSRSFDGLARLFEFIAELFAGLMRFAAYLLLAVGAFFLIRYVVRNIDRFRFRAGPVPERSPPRVLFGFDVRPEALPENLAQIAAATAESDPRRALSLLYRGALATLIHRDRLELTSGDTEQDCVRRVESLGALGLTSYFRRLVAAWSIIAYAQRPPSVTLIRTLCEEWPQHFSTHPEAA